MPLRRELVSWEEVQRLVDMLIQQFEHEFKAMLVITRGGIVPGGMLAERMGLQEILTAAVNFPAMLEDPRDNMLVWPKFLQFPEDELLRSKRVLVVDDVWGSGRTSTAVRTRSRPRVASRSPACCITTRSAIHSTTCARIISRPARMRILFIRGSMSPPPVGR